MMRTPLTVLAAALAGALVTLATLALFGALDGGDDDRSPLAGAVALDGDGRVNDIYRRSRDAVVFIQARVRGEGDSPFGPRRRGRVATGSGFLYDDEGHVVTNAHVVEGAREVAINAGGARLLEADVVGTDLSTDLAVLRVEPDALDAAPLPLGDSSEAEVGDAVVAIGNPFGLEDTVTTGIVSAVQREIRAPNGFAIENAIQSDAAINPGNSGGPLLDARGRVLGVNSQIATAGGGFVGVGFAVPSATVRDIVPQLISDGDIERPFLGVTTATVTESVARQLGLGVESGALVTSVADGSPADRAGIRGAEGGPLGALTGPGDVIVQAGGEDVRTSQDLAERVQAAGVGEDLTLTIVRDGRRLRASVELGDRPG